MARDVGERMEAQANRRRPSRSTPGAELNVVNRAIGDGIFVCEPDGRISLANRPRRTLFPDVEEETYEDILAQLEDPDGDAPRWARSVARSSLARGADERWIEVSTYPVARDESDGDETGPETIVMLRDVTRRGRAS